MAQWARRPEHRDQMVLYATRLDDAIGPEHPVRLFDEILGCLSWTEWEGGYHLRLGQPPIHPRVLASVLLYGVMKRVRTSRALEAALRERIDFRWLAHGFQIDHSALREFRAKHSDKLKDLF